MSKRYSSKSSYAPKKRGAGKIWAGAIAFVLTGAIVASVLGVGTAGYRDWSFSKWFGSNQDQEQTDPDTQEVGGGALITETNESGGISLMSTTIDPSEYEAAGIAEYAVTAYTIKATIEPAEALQEFIWEVSWKDPTNEWATGKDCTNYMQSSVSADTKSMNLISVTAFNEPIIITVTSRYNSEATATCQVDYLSAIDVLTNNSYYRDENGIFPYINSIEGQNISIKDEYASIFAGTITGELILKSATISFNNKIQNNEYFNKFKESDGYDTGFKLNYTRTITDNLTLSLTKSELINNSYYKATFEVSEILLKLDQFLEFNDYTNTAGEKITPTYDNFEGSDYLKYAITYASQTEYKYSYRIRLNFDYMCKGKKIGNTLQYDAFFAQSQAEFPLPADPTGISLDQNNIVFGI